MVVCRDNSVLAQLGTPDMRVPIAYGLSLPERIASGAEALDFTRLAALTFEAPTTRSIRASAWHGTRCAPAGHTAVLNAANEEAVAAFLPEPSASTRFTRQRRHAGAGPLASPASSRAPTVARAMQLDARARGRARARLSAS